MVIESPASLDASARVASIFAEDFPSDKQLRWQDRVMTTDSVAKAREGGQDGLGIAGSKEEP
jgi:hypothetical protein